MTGRAEADRVWSRAAMERGGPNAREGDRALSDALLAHGLVMNGGVDHCVEARHDASPSAFAPIEGTT